MPASTILAVHGSGVGPETWRHLAEAVPTGCVLQCPSRIGYEGAHGPPPSDHRDDLVRLGHLIDAATGPVDLVGHSYGGWLCLTLAVERPSQVRQIVAHDPVAWGLLVATGGPDAAAAFDAFYERAPAVTDGPMGHDAWLAHFLGFWSGAGSWEQIGDAQRARLRRLGPHVHAELSTVRRVALDPASLRALRVPVRITLGDNTPELARQGVARIAATLSDCEVVAVPGGHMAPLTHPSGVMRQFARWLER